MSCRVNTRLQDMTNSTQASTTVTNIGVVMFTVADVDAAAKAIEADGGAIVKGPYDDAHERRAVVYDNQGNGLVFYSPLNR